MFEKTVTTALKGFAAVIYVIIMLALFSVPVIFIYQAVKPPIFTLNSVEITENAVLSDESISITDDDAPSGENADLGVTAEDGAKWTKIDFSLTAFAGRFSPYSYVIESFTLEEGSELSEGEYELLLDAPIVTDNTTEDDFVLSLYVKEGSEADINELAENVSFKADVFEKSFGEFSLKHE